MDKNYVLTTFCGLLFIVIVIGIYHKNNINSRNNLKVFSDISYTVDDNLHIIDRHNDDEFKYILNKAIRKVKPYYSNIVLITSKIIVSNNSFSYVQKRSIYTIETRFKQTIETIESIRKNIPNACIFLIDDSNFEKSFVYMHSKLNDICDVFINPLTDSNLSYYTNVNKHKSIAEGYQIIYFLDIFNKLNIKYDRFFKISGRYIINNSFNINTYITNNIIFSHDQKLNFLYYYTCFYMIPYQKFNMYTNAYKILYINKHNEEFIENNIEFILPMLLKLENIKLIHNLGITQRIAVRDEISDI
jgi:hypothetical protein